MYFSNQPLSLYILTTKFCFILDRCGGKLCTFQNKTLSLYILTTKFCYILDRCGGKVCMVYFIIEQDETGIDVSRFWFSFTSEEKSENFPS